MADAIFQSNVRTRPFLHGMTSPSVAGARPIRSVGVVGAGEMSAAITERLIDAGLPVTLQAGTEELLDEVLARLHARLDERVRKGQLTHAVRNSRARLVEPTCWYVAMSSVDAVIVCEEECEDAVGTVLAGLDRVMKRNAILATTATYTPDDIVVTLLGLGRAFDKALT